MARNAWFMECPSCFTLNMEVCKAGARCHACGLKIDLHKAYVKMMGEALEVVAKKMADDFAPAIKKIAKAFKELEKSGVLRIQVNEKKDKIKNRR